MVSHPGARWVELALACWLTILLGLTAILDQAELVKNYAPRLKPSVAQHEGKEQQDKDEEIVLTKPLLCKRTLSYNNIDHRNRSTRPTTTGGPRLSRGDGRDEL